MKRFFLLIALILPSLWGLAQPNPTIEAFKAEKIFVQGRALFESGDYIGAIEMFDQVVELDDQHPMVFEMRGDAHYEMGSYGKALADYKKAARIHPQNAELRNSMGVAAARQGMYVAASRYFNEALIIDPTHETARENLAKAQLRAKEDPAFVNSTLKQQEFNEIESRLKGKPNSNNLNSKTNPNAKKTTPPPRFPATYKAKNGGLKIGRQTDPYFNITKVEVTPRFTRVYFELKSTGEESFKVQIGDVDSPNAFYITNRSLDRTFKLLDISGLPNWPEEPFTIYAGDKPLEFVANFEKIDDDMYIFHLLEGQEEREGTWDFWDVKLAD